MKRNLLFLIMTQALMLTVACGRGPNPDNGSGTSTPSGRSGPVPALQGLWWRSEYPALVRVVGTSPNSSLSASYRTGPGGQTEVKILLVTTPVDGLILTADSPRETLRSVDPGTGELKPSETRLIFTFRDPDLDGVPDEFKTEPNQEFVKFANDRNEETLLTLWSVYIGFSINHFLHGIDSALPR
ncbi:MAG: hypothetical protein HY313_06640 [Acidobacteria bacterium]|nr:hypothetical protein [Acidobacteriota bacterium]